MFARVLVAVLLVALVAAPAGAATPLYEEGSSGEGFFPRIEAEEAGLSRAAVESLVAGAEAARSDALIVLSRGRTVVERSFGTPPGRILAMSVTKAMASIAVGLLIADGRIPSVEAPMHTWIPEWKDGPKSAVLLSHVLAHTSGIRTGGVGNPLYEAPDTIAYVSALPLATVPGSTFRYNNEASQLLSRVVKSAAGMQIDRYLDERLFRPLGITDWSWRADRAGNVHTFADLSLTPRDLARIGQLLADGGRIGDRQIIPQDWLRASTQPADPEMPWIGYHWFPRQHGTVLVQTPAGLERLRAAGFSAAGLLEPLNGRRFPLDGSYARALRELLSAAQLDELGRLDDAGVKPFDIDPGRWIGFGHDGYLGQYLVVYPQRGLVVIRMRRWVDGETEAEAKPRSFHALYDHADGLATGAGRARAD